MSTETIPRASHSASLHAAVHQRLRFTLKNLALREQAIARIEDYFKHAGLEPLARVRSLAQRVVEQVFSESSRHAGIGDLQRAALMLASEVVTELNAFEQGGSAEVCPTPVPAPQLGAMQPARPTRLLAPLRYEWWTQGAYRSV